MPLWFQRFEQHIPNKYTCWLGGSADCGWTSPWMEKKQGDKIKDLWFLMENRFGSDSIRFCVLFQCYFLCNFCRSFFFLGGFDTLWRCAFFYSMDWIETTNRFRSIHFHAQRWRWGHCCQCIVDGLRNRYWLGRLVGLWEFPVMFLGARNWLVVRWQVWEYGRVGKSYINDHHLSSPIIIILRYNLYPNLLISIVSLRRCRVSTVKFFINFCNKLLSVTSNRLSMTTTESWIFLLK